jgi:hypothetical protein
MKRGEGENAAAKGSSVHLAPPAIVLGRAPVGDPAEWE